MPRQKGFASLIIIFGILILASLVGGVYYFSHSSSQTVPGIVAKKPQTSSATKTYTDSTNSFQFEYSSDLTVKEDSEDDYSRRAGGDQRKNFTSYVQYSPEKVTGAVSVLDKDSSFEKSPFTVWVFENPGSLDAQSWYNKFWYFPFMWGQFNPPEKEPLSPKNEATISGQTAKYGIVSYQNGSPKYYYLPGKGRMFLIRVFPKTEGEQILNTFKLVI